MFSEAIVAALFLASAATAEVVYLRNDFEGGRIVNGTDAPVGKYTSQVSLRNQGSHVCGGSIVTPQFVLTAAHCVYRREASALTILAGTNTLDQGGKIYQVTEIMEHEEFNYFEILNDIALLRVSPTFDFSDDLVGPMTLPVQYEQTVAGTVATVIGWGLSSSNELEVMNNLQEVELFVYTDEECYDILGSPVNPNNICAGVPGGHKDQCNGDSGGPLIVDDHQVGIVSWSKKPCGLPYPGVYTQVSPYVNWIESKVNV